MEMSSFGMFYRHTDSLKMNVPTIYDGNYLLE